METLITKGVEVTVETLYQAGHSEPQNDEYVFAYRITITNHNPFTVQLLSRKWKIYNTRHEIKIVEGEGVVGRQPVLYQSDSHQYVSGCSIETPIGKMEGSYVFENKQTGKTFEVQIPSFMLEYPELLN